MSTTPTNLIPFDLAIALKHPERVRDVHGNQALRVIHIPEVAPDYRVWVLWREQNVAYEYTEDGQNTGNGMPVLFLTAPEPTYVPWDTPSEVPDGAWFRSKGRSVVRQVAAFDCDDPLGLKVQLTGCDVWFSFIALYKNYEWHADRRHKGPWNVCGKPAPQ